MKLKQVATAVSAVLLSSSAFALAPNTAFDPQAPGSTDIELFISGASAQDKSIKALVTSLCVANPDGSSSLDTFKDNANPAKPGKAYTSYFCLMDDTSVPGLVTTRKVLIHKRSKGGSAQGVSPIIAAAKNLTSAAISSMDIYNTANVVSGNCTETATGSKSWLCTIDQPGDLLNRIPNAGVSDVNPKMFIKGNTPVGFDPVDPNDVDNYLKVKAAAALVFGVPVTTDLRNALQEAKFGLGNSCVGSETEACMPSLSKRQVASLISGQIRDWSAFKVNGLALTDPAVTSVQPASTKVHYCRRVPGSGTQAQQNAKFLNYPCTANAPAPKLTSARSGPIIVQNQGSGDVSLCLDDFNNGTNNSAGGSNANPGLITAWALGTQSTEKNVKKSTLQSNGTNYKYDYRFVKINGVAPTLQNAANGSYNDWVEQTFQWVDPAKSGANAPTPDQALIIEKIAAEAATPATIAANNVKYVFDWGQAGYLAVSTNFAPAANGVLDLNAPVIPYTHSVGGNLDNCIVPVVNTTYQASEL